MYLSIYIACSLFTFTPSLLISGVDASTTSKSSSNGISTSTPSKNSSYAFTTDSNGISRNFNFATEVSQIAAEFSCATPATKLIAPAQLCYNNVVSRLNSLKPEHLHERIHNITIGCCFHEQLRYCIKPSIDSSCTVAAVNVTEKLMNRLQSSMNLRCHSSDVKIPFPSDECDEILFPLGQIQQILGLLIAVAVFSAAIVSAAASIIIISKRSKHREQYQAL